MVLFGNFDLEKAYDRIDWNFLEKVLINFNLNDKWVKQWHVSYKEALFFLWNGETLNEFKPTRGLGQGDPLP